MWLFVFFFSSRRRHTRLQGDWSSDVCSSDLIESAVELVAELHMRAAGHPLLPEVRKYSKDLGLPFFITNVGDAIRGLEDLPGAAIQPPKEMMVLRDCLLDRLYPLVVDKPRRAEVLKDSGGPDTLLHGDLW